jgi:hypothetical protein
MALELLLIIVALISIEFSSNNAQAMHSGPSGGSSMTEIGAIKGIDVELKAVKTTPSHWELELTMRNNADYSINVMINPARTDGSNGPYITLNKEGGSILEISSHLYPPPPYFLYTNKAGVELKLLLPKTSYTEALIIKFPRQETMPPYRDKLERIEINADNIKNVRAAVGILPDEDGVRDLLKHKPIGPFVYGREEIMKGSFKGKRLIDLQTIVYSGYNYLSMRKMRRPRLRSSVRKAY